MTRDGVARILAAIGSELVPDGLDKDALKRDLRSAATIFRVNDSLRAPAARTKRLEKILGASKKLLQALRELEPGDLPGRNIVREGGFFVTGDIDIPEPHQVENLIQQVESLLKPLSGSDREFAARFAAEMHLDKRSAFEWLVGVKLPAVYQKHFGIEAKFSRGGKNAYGPYITFVLASLAELDIKKEDDAAHSAEAVARALTGARPPKSPLGKSVA